MQIFLEAIGYGMLSRNKDTLATFKDDVFGDKALKTKSTKLSTATVNKTAEEKKPIMKNTSVWSLLRQAYALEVKRYHYAKRDWKAILCQVSQKANPFKITCCAKLTIYSHINLFQLLLPIFLILLTVIIVNVALDEEDIIKQTPMEITPHIHKKNTYWRNEVFYARNASENTPEILDRLEEELFSSRGMGIGCIIQPMR